MKGYIDKQESNINHRNNIYYPLVLDAENSYSLFQIFLGQKRNMEQENSRQDYTNFTHELSPEYIKGKIEKVVSCSSGPDLFREIFDYAHKQITVDELVEKYYSSSQDETEQEKQGAPPSEKNSDENTISEEQEKEEESDPVGRTEQYSAHSEEKIQEKEQGTTNNNLEDYLCYSCYYCDYKTDNKDHYERHVILRHDNCPAYPNKAEIEKRGLKRQGKDWET